MNRLIGIFGAGGFGREIRALLRRRVAAGDEIAFVEPDSHVPAGPGETPVMAETAFLELEWDRAHIIAIANPTIRARLDMAARDSGSDPLDVISDTAELLSDLPQGSGAVVCSHAVISVDCRIGKGCHVNFHTYLAHDCRIGDYVTFGPRVTCNGNVHVEDRAYLGAGALIRQGTSDAPLVIGAGAIVGMGAVVTKSVAPGIIVVGNPARPMKRI